MKHTVKKTLALMMALMLALPAFVLADDAAVALDANGQAMANDLMLDGDLVLDGDLSLDGISLELLQPEVPEGGLELEEQAPEGGEEPGESPVELEDAGQAIEEEIPEAEPLTPPDWAAGQELKGETDAETVQAANALGGSSAWSKLDINKNVVLDKSYIAEEGDERLLKTTGNATTLDLNGHTLDRNLKSGQDNGGVIAVCGGEENRLTIVGDGEITGGKTNGAGGGVKLDNVNNLGPGYLTLKSGNITGNHAASNGGGVAIFNGSEFTMTGGSITNNSTNGQGGGVYIDNYCLFVMENGQITDNRANGNGGGVYVLPYSKFLLKNTGTVQITGNTKGGKPNNVYLYKDAKIQIQRLDKNSQIGVSMDTPTDDSGVPIPFTDGLGDQTDHAKPDDLIKVFQSDDDDYAVDWVTTGDDSNDREAALWPRIKCTAEDQSIVYDGKAHGIEVKGIVGPNGKSVANSEIKYGTSADGCTEDKSPTVKSVSEKTVYFKITAPNYYGAAGSAKVKITPMTVALDWDGKDAYTYSGQAQGPGATIANKVGQDDVGVTMKYKAKGAADSTLTDKKPVDAGEYVAVAVGLTGADKANYQLPEERTKEFAIKKAAMTVRAEGYKGKYDGKAHGISVTVTAPKSAAVKYGTAADACDKDSLTYSDAGKYTVCYQVTAANYVPATGSATVEITPRTVALDWDGNAAYTYNGQAQGPGATIANKVGQDDVGVTVQYKAKGADDSALTDKKPVDAGDYVAVAVGLTGADRANYQLPEETTKAFTIARRKATVTAIDQQVETVDAVRSGAEAVKAEGLAKGQTLKSVVLAVSVKEGANKGEIVPGKAEIADAKGNDVTGNYELRYVAGSLTLIQKPKPEPEPAKPDYTLLAVMKTCRNRALRVSWTRVPGADGYEVTFVKEDRGFRKAEVVSVRALNTWKFTGLKKNTAYKATVRAWKYKGNARIYIGKKSPVVCAITGDVRKNKTNADRVCMGASRVKLNVGKRTKVSATVKGVKRGKKVMRWENALLRWYSSDANVAVVNAKGEIRAVGAGECTVYALAANGVRGAVKVKVK